MIHAAIKRTGILAFVICACVAIVPAYLLHAHGKAAKENAQATSAATEQRPSLPNPIRLADRMLFDKMFSANRPSAQPQRGTR